MEEMQEKPVLRMTKKALFGELCHTRNKLDDMERKDIRLKELYMEQQLYIGAILKKCDPYMIYKPNNDDL